MHCLTIVTNGISAPIELEQGLYRVGVEGDCDGEMSLKHNLPSGAKVQIEDAHTWLLSGPADVQISVTGATETNLTFYAQLIEEPE